jgi:sodium transport system permease protein
MKSGLMSIMSKEFKRFFTDKRMVITTLLLPGLIIYLLYTVMGSALGNMLRVSDDYRYQVAAVNMPASLEPIFKQSGLDFEVVAADDNATAGALKQRLTDKDFDLLAVFPSDFDADVAATLGSAPSLAAPGNVPNVELYYNSTRTESSTAYSIAITGLEGYKSAIAPLFSINASEGTAYDLVTEQDKSGFMLASLLPFIMMIFLFSGVMGVAPESIAGEKERGTIATILVTPLKRWELALGKIVSLSFISLLSGASSFIGVMASLPNLLGAGDSDSGAASALIYSTMDYLVLLLVIVCTLLCFVGLISLLSAFARNVKEASTLVMPLMVLVMMLGAMAMFSQTAQENLLFYLIPVYNSVQCMVGIFSFSYNIVAVALTITVNLLLTGICVVVLTAMFNSERVVFAK